MLRIYAIALEVMRRVRPFIEIIEAKDRDLGRQMRKAGASVVLNIAEGSGSSGGTRRERYRNALGSAREFRGCGDVACAFGYVECIPMEGLPEVIGSLVRLTR